MKQVIIIRNDLKLPKGKAAAQAAHASVDSFFKTLKKKPDFALAWLNEGMAKIVLKCSDEKELINIFQMAKDKGLVASLITDAGKTVVAPGTKTAVAIGPDYEDKIDEITKNLKLY